MNFYFEGGTAIQGRKLEPVAPCADLGLISGAVRLGGWPSALTDYFVQSGASYDDTLRVLLQAATTIQ